MSSIKDIKRRIKSVGSTKKVTRAMEMVSAAKMRRAVEAVLRTRTYANLSWGTVLNLVKSQNDKSYIHPLMSKKTEVKRTAIIMITSNRGLCAGFNTNLINKVHKSIVKYQENSRTDTPQPLSRGELIETDMILIGKKGRAIHKFFDYNIYAEFPKSDIAQEVKEVIPIAKMIIKDYLENKFDKVMVAYTDYVNASVQIPRIRQLLPIDISADDEYLGVVGKDTRVGTEKKFIADKQDKYHFEQKDRNEYIFEPNSKEVLDEMIPRLIEIQLFQALLESNASEHSARMAAMHQATDAANDLVDELTLFYNKTRQANITREITEISAGANAL